MSLKAINLNLAPVLRELLRTRSVSEAGRVLGRSPSAVSDGLAQLRVLFRDPLLVRAQGGMTLTPRAIALIDPIEQLCAQAEGVFEPSRVDPAVTKRCVTIAAHDYYAFTLGPELVRMFRAAAPLVTLRFVDLGPDLGRQLTGRDVDFALMPDFYFGLLATSRLEHVALPEEPNVVLMRAGHPLAGRATIDQQALIGFEQVAFQPNWEPVDYRRAVAALFRHLPIRARVSQIVALPQFVAGSDYIAVVPLALAERLGAMMGLVHRPLDVSPSPVRPVLAWSAVQGADGFHAWFRAMVAERFPAEP